MVCTHGQASSTHCRCVSTFPSIMCDFRDSATSHHPLASSCINVDFTRHPFAGSMPRILRTGQLARNFGTIHAICPSSTISTPSWYERLRMQEGARSMALMSMWSRSIERFPIGDPGASLYRTLPPGWPYCYRRLCAIEIVCGARSQYSWTFMQAWKTRSGKPDGVSAQHTSEGFLKSRGAGSAGSRRSGPVKSTASLDSERRILCQRTAGRKYIVNVGPNQADGSLRRVEPTWRRPGRGVRVANVNTARSCKQTLGSSGEQRLNRYRDVRLHSGRYLHRSSVKTTRATRLAVNNNTTVEPHRYLYIRSVAHTCNWHQTQR